MFLFIFTQGKNDLFRLHYFTFVPYDWVWPNSLRGWWHSASLSLSDKGRHHLCGQNGMYLIPLSCIVTKKSTSMIQTITGDKILWKIPNNHYFILLELHYSVQLLQGMNPKKLYLQPVFKIPIFTKNLLRSTTGLACQTETDSFVLCVLTELEKKTE